MPLVSQYRLRVKLHTFDIQRPVSYAHYLIIVSPGCHFKALWQTLALNNK